MVRLFGLFFTYCYCSTNGVPDDLSRLIPSELSSDYGLYSECEVSRGTGLMSGVCVPSSYYENRLSFCADVVNYPSCVPPSNPWWPTWNISSKDSLIESLYTDIVNTRLEEEQISLDTNGENGYYSMFFTGNDECVKNFKRIICLFNFPRCDYSGTTSGSDSEVTAPTGKANTLGICRESCHAYFSTCKLKSGETFCDAIGSNWPLQLGSTGGLNTSSGSLLMESLNEGFACTGSNAREAKEFHTFVLMILLYV
jgi:hypothetical protein